jgi:hypothetical protein
MTNEVTSMLLSLNEGAQISSYFVLIILLPYPTLSLNKILGKNKKNGLEPIDKIIPEGLL